MIVCLLAVIIIIILLIAAFMVDASKKKIEVVQKSPIVEKVYIKKCEKCGFENDSKNTFCGKCGAKL